ncbi:hypothetical protein [Sphingomonas sp. SKA58]|uniref:hypothetical protein n=1 Tax=Sphingomonas sp. (strain SKA58) TaxID=314266 RepID=UPI001E50D84B|nr:hypothetical protein [Sphingomonas sp. SKA58]
MHELVLALLALGAACGCVLGVFFFARLGWLGWGAGFAMGSFCVSCWMLLAWYLFHLGVHLRAAGKPRVEIVDGGRLHFGRLAPGLWLAPDDVVVWQSAARRQLFMLFRDPTMARGVRSWAMTWPRRDCLVLTIHDLTPEEMDLVLRWGARRHW